MSNSHNIILISARRRELLCMPTIASQMPVVFDNGASWDELAGMCKVCGSGYRIITKTAVMRRQRYDALAQELGEFVCDRVDAKATPAQKKTLAKLAPQQVRSSQLAGEKITAILTDALGACRPFR